MHKSGHRAINPFTAANDPKRKLVGLDKSLIQRRWIELSVRFQSVSPPFYLTG